MVTKNTHLAIKLMVVAAASLALGAGLTVADNWQNILEKTKAKYANYENEIQDMITLQEIQMMTPGRVLTADSKMFKKGEKFRMESVVEMPEMPKEMGGMRTVVINDGKATWMISSILGKQKLSGEEEAQYQTEGDWWGFLTEKAKLIGSERIDSRTCHVVEIEEGRGVPYSKIWIDEKHLVLVRANSKGPQGQHIQMDFSDFRKIGSGWEIPYKTDVYMDGDLISTVLVKAIEINKGLSDELFDPENADVEGPSMQDMMRMMQEQNQ
ncbi:MAG: outer membrane lipoprotein-sorting protein [Candidatus Latescibacteria bacterium]|nr:outer membrane lipoprotein-sorting protein [Candidatus Latescibacterota bacterium]NIM66270.1 outer membrane lipoprotein-sorting protein [Candidatus Latescibacterota bacterium]NIO02751.1 outer membrane lipoprotein-sorting protein [Candidatus Latescibacterota bacterium]NIO29886.1 outer membrane lipoprotein-sorting protein [Candidatus Latescibacterota bacterium]NIO57500.1 outer membrane lipoprotein-sorting protein [Candidatus Latescibacterota bacterium]